MAATGSDEQRLALFIDFENIAIGVRDAHYRKFDVNLVLERLLEKGKLLVKKAYADWSRYADYKRSFHEAAIELIEVPQKSIGGKNSADIRLVVDAMDMSFQKDHINCFVVASGDSDFSPLVSKLKENNKYVIGLGVKNSTSDLLIENCDEFIFYEDLVRGQQRPMPSMANLPGKLQECFELLVDAVVALQRENKDTLWGSMVKETMKRKKPSFNETYYGFRTFSHLLEDAQRRGVVSLRRDQKSGSYVIEDLGAAAASGAGAARAEAPAARAAEPARGERVAAGSAAAAGPASAAAAEGEGEGEGNGRGRGRRRGRGGRRRERPAAAETAEAAEAAEAAAADETGDEEDEGSESLAPPENEGESSGEERGTPAEGPAEGAAQADASRERTERSPFSFFSWLRGEKDDEAARRE